MAAIPDEAKHLLEGKHFAHVATIHPTIRISTPARTLRPSLTSNTLTVERALPVSVAALPRFMPWLTLVAF